MKYELKIDLYTKVILTLIAISLLGLFLKPLIFPSPTKAQSSRWERIYLNEEPIDVNIKEINGNPLGLYLPVAIKYSDASFSLDTSKPIDVIIWDSLITLPVKIKGGW